MAALAATVTWKLVGRPSDAGYLEPEIGAFLASHDLQAVATDDTTNGFPVLRATRGGCQMLVMAVSYYGADRDVVRGLTPAGARAMFIYRGKIYADQPVWRIVSDQIWMRFLRSLGLSDHDPPVLAVAAPPQCHAEQLPWTEIR